MPKGSRERSTRQSQGLPLFQRIKSAKVLLVGAGGIGCELLKNLVLTGFGEVDIVDLDTIDLSNLNRQFLFQHQHIKKSKAIVAKEAASRFNPNVKLEAYHANIKESRFNIEWFSQFTVVFNALDNLDARRHVNKMCLAADVPLIESGTTGFDGQVQVIKRGKTECYDCNPKPVQKSYPVCTIRSTPSQPIHCVVWAKSYLFQELFGTSEDEVPEVDQTEDTENASEIKNLQEEARALKTIRESMGGEGFREKVFEKVFDSDIKRLVSMEDMWKNKKAPTPMQYKDISDKADQVSEGKASEDQLVWSVVENCAVFFDSLQRLSKRMADLKSTPTTETETLSFDKDDEDTLDFVASAANLRSVVFGVEPKSKFDIKQMAGNIIPAIATTNAMVAGLCVMQAFKVMREQFGRAKTIFLERSGARIINSELPRPPNPNCAVCGIAQALLTIDPERATLGHLVKDILQEKLGYGEELSISTAQGLIYDPDLEENLSKKFSELGISKDTFVTVIDDEDEPKVNLSLAIAEKPMAEDEGPVLVPTDLEIGKKPKPAVVQVDTTTNGVHEVNGHNDSTKRKREAENDAKTSPLAEKKGKTNGTAAKDDDVVLINDDEGHIVIDD